MPSSISSSSAPAAPDTGAGGAVASATPIDGLRHADELEEAHREVPDRPWGRIALTALVLTLALMAGWEALWRHEGYQAGDIKNTKAAWAEQRRRAVGDATVLIGTSRNLFDVNLDVWQRVTGVRPIQLSLEGTSPRFLLADLAADPKFHGLVISDVTSGLFFTQFAGHSETPLAYYQHETPSQRIGRYLSVWPEKFLAYIDDQTRPKDLWGRLPLPTRPGQSPYVDAYKVGVSEADRNSRMWDVQAHDLAYRNREIAVWGVLLRPPPGAPPPDAAKVIAEVAANVAKIRARGGDVVFVMHPSGGWVAQEELKGFPRAKFWDPLLAQTHAGGVRYDDYPQLQEFRFPELSHIDPDDARTYTARLAPLVEAEAARTKVRSSP